VVGLRKLIILLIAFLILALMINGAETTLENLVTALLIAMVVRVVIEIADD